MHSHQNLSPIKLDAKAIANGLILICCNALIIGENSIIATTLSTQNT